MYLRVQISVTGHSVFIDEDLVLKTQTAMQLKDAAGQCSRTRVSLLGFLFSRVDLAKKPKNKTNVRMLLPKAKRKSGSDPWISGKKKENYQSLNYFGVYAYSAINIFMFLYRYIMSGVLKNDFLSGKQPFFAYYLL